jgi:hypothetical protein
MYASMALRARRASFTRITGAAWRPYEPILGGLLDWSIRTLDCIQSRSAYSSLAPCASALKTSLVQPPPSQLQKTSVQSATSSCRSCRFSKDLPGRNLALMHHPKDAISQASLAGQAFGLSILFATQSWELCQPPLAGDRLHYSTIGSLFMAPRMRQLRYHNCNPHWR